MTLVEGLEDGRFAILTKVHQALVDGIARSTSARSSWTYAPSRATRRRTTGGHCASRRPWSSWRAP